METQQVSEPIAQMVAVVDSRLAKALAKKAIAELRERDWFEEVWADLDQHEREDTLAQLSAYLGGNHIIPQ